MPPTDRDDHTHLHGRDVRKTAEYGRQTFAAEIIETPDTVRVELLERSRVA
jgi:hypothetical protein